MQARSIRTASSTARSTALSRRLLAIGTTAALIVGVGGMAMAATISLDGATNTIKGCVTTKTGALTLLTASHTKCSSGQKPISWNQTGPAGPPGPASTGYFTGGDFASNLGSAATVATLPLPAGSFIYNVSVNFANSTASADDVTCTLNDGGANQVDATSATVPASASQDISLTGASKSIAGPAKVSCKDSANSVKASVDGAAFSATQTGKLPTSKAVLRDGSVGGAAIAAGHVLSSSFAPPQCTSGSTSATVSTNPAAPGTATLSITSMSFSGCTFSVNGSSVAVTITANNLPYSLTIGDVDGNTATTGAVNFTVTAPSLGGISCTYTSTGLTGNWNNAANGITFGQQNLTKTSGLCPAQVPISGTFAPVRDTKASGSPLVFVS